MYIWQLCFDCKYVVYGRTWNEFKIFLKRLKERLPLAKIVIYVHNLSFEFQFARNFFNVKNVFAKEARLVVKCDLDDVEFRCSYMLSNMSLQKLTETTKGVIHKKLVGDLDYSIERYPDTWLNDTEFLYAIFDVIGLCEVIRTYLEEDTIATIPLTSTGFVRRAYREVCLQDEAHMSMFRKSALDEETYLLCKEATRGGVAGSNPMYTNDIVENVTSYDRKSSYPHVMEVKKFPVGKFSKVSPEDLDEYITFAGCLIDVTYYGIELKNWVSIPYISHGKCRAAINGKYGNGKVYSADMCRMTITEIDFKLIAKYYKWESMQVNELRVAYMDYLSKSFRETLMQWFAIKEAQKNGDYYLYMKSKNKINASFGMMLTDIAIGETEYTPDEDKVWKPGEINVKDRLKSYYRNKNSFLSYQHGVWVTAHARAELYRAMDIVGDDIVLTDTDSCKTLGEYDEEFNRLNHSIIEEAERCNVHPWLTDKDGNRTSILGVWEKEGTYKKFRTMGTKKYCFYDNDKFKIVVSGLNPKSGADYLSSISGKEDAIKYFKPGIEIPPSHAGRTSSHYWDNKGIIDITIDGHDVTIGSGISIENVSYTLGETKEWLGLIDDVKEM